MDEYYYKNKFKSLQQRCRIMLSNSQSNLLFNTDIEALYKTFIDQECDDIPQKESIRYLAAKSWNNTSTAI